MNKCPSEPHIKNGKFEYYGNCWSNELIEVVDKQLNELSWLIPNWAQYVTVMNHVENNDNAAANCYIDYGERTIRIGIFPAFFVQNPTERREMLIHELVHGFGKIFADYARYIVRKLLPEDEPHNKILRETILNELNERNESWTQDLAYAIREKIYPDVMINDNINERRDIRKLIGIK